MHVEVKKPLDKVNSRPAPVGQVGTDQGGGERTRRRPNYACPHVDFGTPAATSESIDQTCRGILSFGVMSGKVCALDGFVSLPLHLPDPSLIIPLVIY